MTAKEMIEYLQMFPEDSEIGIIIIADKENKKACYVDKVVCITDYGEPVFFLEAGEIHDMDEEFEEGNENG